MKPFVSHLLMPSCHAVRQTLWYRFAAVPLLFGAAMSVAQTPPPVYPQVGPTTISLVRILSSAVFPSWPRIKAIFLSSIYRIKLSKTFTTNVGGWRIRLRNILAQKNGWIVTEFLSPAFYSAPYRFKSEVTN
jgi:hypothetical protein